MDNSDESEIQKYNIDNIGSMFNPTDIELHRYERYRYILMMAIINEGLDVLIGCIKREHEYLQTNAALKERLDSLNTVEEIMLDYGEDLHKIANITEAINNLKLESAEEEEKEIA